MSLTITLVGDSFSGKTSFARFLGKANVDEENRTLPTQKFTERINDKDYQIKIIDTNCK